MKIFALCTWCPHPLANGMTIRGYHLLRALAARHDVDLVAFTPLGPPPQESVDHLRSVCSAVTILPKDPFYPLRTAGRDLLSLTPRSLVATHDPEVRALAQARAARAAVAVGFGLHAVRYLESVDAPVVFEEAEPGQIANPYRSAPPGLARLRRGLTWWKSARYFRKLAAAMSAVTVVSEAERSLLERIGVSPGTIYVIPNGADAADTARPRQVERPVRLIYPGSITYAPNLEAVRWCLTHVMPRLRETHRDLDLWVTGDTGDIALADLPNANFACFTGRLPDVKGAISGSAVTVVPLLTGGGTRLKILESLALGTPVVSTEKGAEGLDLEDGRHLLIADTPAAFAAAVQRLLGDDTLAERLSAEGRKKVVDAYTWDVSGRRLLDVVERVHRRMERQ